MVKKIFRNTFLTSLVAVILSVGLILFIFYGYFEEQLVANLKAEGKLLANGVKHAGIEYFENFEPTEGMRITWIDQDGAVLYDSMADISSMDNHSQREEIIEAFEKGEADTIRHSDTLAERTIYYAKLLEDNTVIRISYGYNTMVGVFFSMLQPVLLGMLILSLAVYVVSSYTAKAVVKPINEIDIESGEIQEIKGYDEIKPLLKRIRRQNLQIDTKVRQLKREHERREDFRREFTANVSHELKTPLTSISGISEMMLNGIIKEDDIPEFAGNINKEASRLISLVNDIILISELEGNEQYMQKEEVNIAELAASVIKRLEIPAAKRHVKMLLSVVDRDGKEVNIQEHMPKMTVFGVYNMIEQLIFNLSDNAIKYNKESGSVNIIVTECKKTVKITVEDTGIGIADEDKKSVFERFYRVDKGRSKEVGGTGLGLSIVKHVALYHGGGVHAEDRPGGGTRMIAELPK